LTNKSIASSRSACSKARPGLHPCGGRCGERLHPGWAPWSTRSPPRTRRQPGPMVWAR
jgi:hypothetical protein